MNRLTSKENHCESSFWVYVFIFVKVASFTALKQFLASSQTAPLLEAAITCCPAATCSSPQSRAKHLGPGETWLPCVSPVSRHQITERKKKEGEIKRRLTDVALQINANNPGARTGTKKKKGSGIQMWGGRDSRGETPASSRDGEE